MGLPGAGKSTTARALASLLRAQFFLEPEEEQWPEFVHRRELVGRFTALTWFRCSRVPGLIEASRISDHGGTAIVDSYYDKLLALYIDKPEFAWLIPKSDSYFPVAARMAEEDYARLPVTDVLILLKNAKDVWLQLMHTRARRFDLSASLHNFFAMQDGIENASREFAATHSTRLIVMEQHFSSPAVTAQRVYEELKKESL